MLQWHTNDQLNQQHHHDLMKEAEKQQLVQQAQGSAAPADSLYAPLLASFGRQLSHLGHRLQATYETPTSLTKAQAK